MKLWQVFVCSFDVMDHVTGFGNPDWKNTHEPADRTALVITMLLKNGATCVGKTVMDELSFGYQSSPIYINIFESYIDYLETTKNEDEYACHNI